MGINSSGGAELGYQLHPAVWGRGYATEALLHFLPLVVLPMSQAVGIIDPIEAWTAEGNSPSERVLTKVGFMRKEERTVPDEKEDEPTVAAERAGSVAVVDDTDGEIGEQEMAELRASVRRMSSVGQEREGMAWPRPDQKMGFEDERQTGTGGGQRPGARPKMITMNIFVYDPEKGRELSKAANVQGL
jgi:hypothetical protein